VPGYENGWDIYAPRRSGSSGGAALRSGSPNGRVQPAGPDGGGGFDYVRDVVAPAAERVHRRVKEVARKAYCSATRLLPPNGRLRIGADAAGFAGLGGALGMGVSLQRDGSLAFDAYAGWGAGVGGVAGAGISIDNNARGSGTVRTMEGFASAGYKVGGATATYSAGRVGLSGGVSFGPKIGYAAGFLKTTTHTSASRSVCK
jgi:hypothetical protein